MTFEDYQVYVISYEGYEPTYQDYVKFLTTIDLPGIMNQLREDLIDDVHRALLTVPVDGQQPFWKQEKYIRDQIINRCNDTKLQLEEIFNG